MHSHRFDVIVVGAGPAGITAAVSLGRAGLSVLVCEAAVYPGAENWSGAVYFTENLEAEDAFGREVVEGAPFERRLVERGFYLYDGHSLLGAALRDRAVFRSCYTVLRPVYDRYLAEVAREHGVVLLEETTVQSLIRHGGRVVGVHTERGPAYADVVFLAEGDASHLVTQEGYELVDEEQRARGAPHFLQGVKEVVSLPPEVIEERFGLGSGEGAAYEMLLRNGTRAGRTVRLNMGGFFYVNRDSVSLGFVLPLDNLARHFDGDHNLLMEWFKGLPEIARWIDGGEVTSFGTKIIRGGGFREIPRLVDDGLAIGGAATGIGLDFPYPNFTGPATAMGLLFARAVRSIREDAGPGGGVHDGPAGGDAGDGAGRPVGDSPFTAAALERAYLEPLRDSHYWKNVAYLRDWPGYIERTQIFFERQLDLVNGSAVVLSRPDLSAPRRWWEWVRLLRRAVPAETLGGVLDDARTLARTVGFGKLLRGALASGTGSLAGRWLLNTVTALLPSDDASIGAGARVDPRADGARADDAGAGDTGTAEARGATGARLRATFRVDGGAEPPGRAPLLVRWWWGRFGPRLADAFVEVYTNDRTPLEDKLQRAFRHLLQPASIWDALVKLLLGLGVGITALLQVVGELLAEQVLRRDRSAGPGAAAETAGSVLAAGHARRRLDDEAVAIRTGYEVKLGTISYREGAHSHIKVLWPEAPTERGRLARSPLWHVCPAHVYEVHPAPRGLPGVVVNYENCIKCESCWRATGDVDWSRATRQRLVYETYTPTHGELRDYLLSRPEPAARRPAAPGFLDELWGSVSDEALASAAADGEGEACSALAGARAGLEEVAAGLEAYAEELERSPLALETGRTTYLVRQLSAVADAFAAARRCWDADGLAAARTAAGEPVERLWDDAGERLREAVRHAGQERFFWARVLGEQLRDHHLAGLLGVIERAAAGRRRADAERLQARDDGAAAIRRSLDESAPTRQWDWARAWRRIEARPALGERWREALEQELESTFDARALRELERGRPPSEEQRTWLRDVAVRALELDRDPAAGDDGSGPASGPSESGDGLEAPDAAGPPLPPFGFRDVLLELLGAADPSLAVLVARHLLAADVVSRAGLEDVAAQLRGGRAWATLAAEASLRVEADGDGGVRLSGVAPLVALAGADWIVLVQGRHGFLVPAPGAGAEPAAGAETDPAAGEATSLQVEDARCIGLLGAGVRRLTLRAHPVPAERRFELPADVVDLAFADHLAIVRGAGDYLLQRARDHAAGRVQFPDAFQDEAGHDTIAKFGAVKQMLAEMQAQRTLVEALSMYPATGGSGSGLGGAAEGVADGSADGSADGARDEPGPTLHAAVAKVLAAEAFGPGEGSFSYNAGQVFGGTAYSEDDVIAKFYRDSGPFRFLLAHDDALRVGVGRRTRDAVRSGRPLVPVSDDEEAWLERLADDPVLGDCVARWRRGREVVESWARDAAGEHDAAEHDAVCHHAGEMVIRALAAKLVLLRAGWRRVGGLPAEATVEAARLWADRWAAEAPRIVAEAELVHETLAVGDDAVDGSDLEPVAPIADAGSYGDLLADEHAHRSGEWLQRPFDASFARYVPELLWSDERLRGFRTGLEEELRRRYVRRRFDGLPYGRYLEKIHAVPEEDRDFLVERGFLRMPIAAELGGEQALKAEYYILCQLAGRYGDASLSLLIMANTSIGTTPITIGLHQDLPRARRELERVRDEPALLGDIRAGLDELVTGLQRPDPQALRRRYGEVAELVKRRIGRSDVLKYVGAGFLRAFFAAGKAGEARDLEGFATELRRARELIDSILEGVDDRLREYPRRERAHELFLKMISAGYVSAFALTEPTAGSDSGGVKTQARLRRRRVFEDPDGVPHFYVDDEAERSAVEAAERRGVEAAELLDDESRRVLLDADRLEFDFEGHRLLYRWSDDAEPSEIRHDGYDYEKDRPGHWRSYRHGDREVAFTDIAQVRVDEGGDRWYEFWELSGAKMWITNGRYMDLMALYARTEPEGVTGFMVDRHAEGLVVGADEEKLGQRGSPTNELSLNRVRVPRECIIGFRGRGQVNALETLNVGRAGLAVTTSATIQEMLEDAAPWVETLRAATAMGDRGEAVVGEEPGSGGDDEAGAGVPAPVPAAELGPGWEGGDLDGGPPPRAPAALDDYWMGRLMEELLATTSMASELTGLLDQPRTEGVRMESAVGKYYGSEAQHACIDWMERLRGVEGQTGLHRIEKTRRDARVLNIYEGTNEVQRFLLLKDLVQRVLPAIKERRPGVGRSSAIAAFDELGYAELADTVEDIRLRLVQHLDDAVAAWGDQVWANVNLQPCTFRLAEIAGLVKVMDAVLYRMEWVARHDVADDHARRVSRAGRLFIARAEARVGALERRYRTAREHLSQERYPPEVQLGFLTLEEDGAAAEAWGRVPERHRQRPHRPSLPRDVGVHVLLKPVPVVGPRPRLAGGAFTEALYAINPADRAALRRALRLKEADPERVRVTACVLAGSPASGILRQALAMGADAALQLDPGGAADGNGAVLHDPRRVAAAAAGAVTAAGADLVLCGSAASDTGQGAVGLYLAASLGWDQHEGVEDVVWTGPGDEPALQIRAAGWEGRTLLQGLPCVLAIKPRDDHGHLPFSLQRFVEALDRPIERRPIEALLDGDGPPAMTVRHRPRTVTAGSADGDGGGAAGRPTDPADAAEVLLRVCGLDGAAAAAPTPYGGPIRGLDQQGSAGGPTCLFVAEPAAAQGLSGSTRGALETAERLATAVDVGFDVVLPVGGDPDAEAVAELAGGVLAAVTPRRIYVVRHPRLQDFSWRGHLEWMRAFRGHYEGPATWLLATPWARPTLARLAAADAGPAWSWFNVEALERAAAGGGDDGGGAGNGARGSGDRLRAATGVFGGTARAEAELPLNGGLKVLTLARSVELRLGELRRPGALEAYEPRVLSWEPELDYDPDDDLLVRLQARRAAGDSLEQAEYVVDLGYGAGGREGLEQLAEPLRRLLADELGLEGVAIGATRKVTQDQEILPMDRQIGQTGVRVDPKLILALAVSGAPQHVDYIGERATVISFNIDPDAPLMRLNEQRPRPVVHPVVGDVWETVPHFIEAVRRRLEG